MNGIEDCMKIMKKKTQNMNDIFAGLVLNEGDIASLSEQAHLAVSLLGEP